MKKRTSILVIGAALLLVMATGVFAQTPAFHDIRPGYGVTQIGWLSDYHPALRGTPGDTRVYTLDSGNPGSTVLVVGGTHGNEISGVMAATVLVERALPTQGRLIIIPHGNNANTDYLDGTFPNVPDTFTVTTPNGVERTFRYGSRRTNPAYESLADPDEFTRGDGAIHAGNEIRNLNRVHPGVADGTLTQQISHGIVQLLLEEEVDVAFDLHEASVGSRIANTLVAHQRAMDAAVLAILDLSMQGIHINLEPSQEEFRGLSHREWGDHTPALAVLTETVNPGQTASILHPDIVNDPTYPLHDRVGRQLALVRAVLDATEDLGLAAPVHYDGVPTYERMLQDGLGAWLNSATAKP